MTFERNNAQRACEQFVGCADDLECWKSRQDAFKEISIDLSKKNTLANALNSDTIDFYYRGLFSLFEAILSLNKGLFSWSTIKLYYSVYYFLRASLAANSIAIIRNRSLYYLINELGQMPQKKRNKKYNTSHEGTINYYIDLLGTNDKLLDNNIDNLPPYLWLNEVRNIINYRDRVFREPIPPDYWKYCFIQIQNNQFKELIDLYINDDFVWCFQENHACLALPIKRAILTKQDLDVENIAIGFTEEQVAMLDRLLELESGRITVLDALYK